MVDKFYIFMGAATIILIITFIIFTVFYVKDKDKTDGLYNDMLECTGKLDGSKQDLAESDVALRNCQRAQEQLTATLDVNFEVDTTGFNNPNFIRDHTTDKKGNKLTKCNYPLTTPRFVYDINNYQNCNFAFKDLPNDSGQPRCSAKNPDNNGYGKCATTITSSSETITAGDSFIFGGYEENVTPCYYWKLVNLLNSTIYQFDIVLSYFTDTKIEEVIYTSKKGDPSIIDSSITKLHGKGDSCMPANIRGKISAIGVKGTSMEGQSELYYFSIPAQNFVMSLWFNESIKSPSMSIGYVITDA